MADENSSKDNDSNVEKISEVQTKPESLNELEDNSCDEDFTVVDEVNNDDMDVQDIDDTDDGIDDILRPADFLLDQDDSVEDADLVPEFQEDLEDEQQRNRKLLSDLTSEELIDKCVNLTQDANEKEESKTNGYETLKKGTLKKHPYLDLIENYEIMEEQMKVIDYPKPKCPSTTPLYCVATKMQLTKAVEIFKKEKEIAVDVIVYSKEYKSVICLMSITTKDSDFIIDTMKLKDDLTILNDEIFTNPKILKIIYHSRNVLLYLQELNLYTINLFDVERFFVSPGKNSKISTVLKRTYSVERVQDLRSEYFQERPLKDVVKKMARQQTHYLIHLYHEHKNKMLKTNITLYGDLLKEFRETCKVMRPSLVVEMFESLVKKIKRHYHCQITVLEKLYVWRDTIARQHNKKPTDIFPNDDLQNLAINLPWTQSTVAACIKSNFLKSYKSMIVRIIHEARKEFDLFNEVLADVDMDMKRKAIDNTPIPKSNRKNKKAKINEQLMEKSHEKYDDQDNKTMNPKVSETNPVRRITTISKFDKTKRPFSTINERSKTVNKWSPFNKSTRPTLQQVLSRPSPFLESYNKFISPTDNKNLELNYSKPTLQLNTFSQMPHSSNQGNKFIASSSNISLQSGSSGQFGDRFTQETIINALNFKRDKDMERSSNDFSFNTVRNLDGGYQQNRPEFGRNLNVWDQNINTREKNTLVWRSCD